MGKIYNSRPREIILETLKSTRSHPTAENLFIEARKKLPRLSLGTVYRNLRLMVGRGEILELDLGTSFSRFDGDTHDHYHFLCLSCGSVLDVNFTAPQDFYDKAASGTDLKITAHQLSFSGYCEKCKRLIN